MDQTMTRKTFIAGAATLASMGALASVAHADAALAADGTYTTSALGRGGYFDVETTIADGKIAAVKPAENHLETALIAATAFPATEEAMVANNSYLVDAVAGCTFTCGAMMTAVRAAIEEAGGDPKAYENMPAVEVPADEVIDCDVCVIGGGISGVMAASKAAADGANVVLLEKSVFLGGCCLHSSGATAFGTQAARDAGEDSETLIRESSTTGSTTSTTAWTPACSTPT